MLSATLSAAGRAAKRCGVAAAALSVFALTCCSGDDGATGASGKDADDPLKRSDPLPGFNLQIVRVEGGSGPSGNFLPGDRPRVTFTATEGAQGSAAANGKAIPPEAWTFQELLFAGPSTSYQLILSSRDIADNSVRNPDGSHTLTFPEPIPGTVPDQINQENTIPYESGTLAGQALPDGTYTIGMSLRQEFVIEGTTWRDATSTTADVLLGNATQIEPRELVTDANCMNCHTQLRAHGANRFGVKYCVLCHANGAEDLNDPEAEAGTTPGLSISFQTMIHKIHAGAHLPSVNGKTVGGAGNPVYGEGKPYVIVRSRGEFDFSHVAFPQWPHLSQGMPRDTGYGDLDSDQRSAENAILAGPTNCAACHGDPDGSGELPAPAQGDAIFTNRIVTRACIACHDDWDPAKPYTANGQTMPAGLGDDSCTACHGESPTNPNSAVNVRKAHTHPLLDTNSPPLWGAGAGTKGLQFNVKWVAEAPDGGNGADGDGVIEAGEKIQVGVDIVDADGAAIPPGDVKRMEIVVSGPVSNPNLLYVTGFNSDPSRGVPPPTSVLGSGPRHAFRLPERVELEIASPVSSTQYVTARTPHYDSKFGSFGETKVWTVATATGIGGILVTKDVSPYQNFVDVNDASSISRGDIVVIDEGNAGAEYLEVANVQSNRLWFAAPIDNAGVRLAKPHFVGSEVLVVSPVAQSGFTLDESTGTITFTSPPTDRVLVSYTTDFVVPDQYRGAINNSPSIAGGSMLDARIGEWTGLDLVDGTYNIGIFGEIGFDVEVSGGGLTQTTSYTEGSEGETVKGFRIGSAGELEVNTRISATTNCNSCHRDLQFHGAHRRGVQNCLLCHGSSGAEDWPIYKTANLSSPETPETSIEFRNMLHKIHHGGELAAGENYVVAGFRGSAHTYEEVHFPSFRGGTANCAACHGADNEAWKAPSERVHPSSALNAPQLAWRFVCASCHDDRSALGHIMSNSSGDIEGCAVCHGSGKELSVEVAHKNFVR